MSYKKADVGRWNITIQGDSSSVRRAVDNINANPILRYWFQIDKIDPLGGVHSNTTMYISLIGNHNPRNGLCDLQITFQNVAESDQEAIIQRIDKAVDFAIHEDTYGLFLSISTLIVTIVTLFVSIASLMLSMRS